ncbi:MAG: VWA domain-containing protein [Chthoniobacterales bacterium]|nr:VWA domain-containing protein [Chthoniobacterales bacterium]
MHPLNLLPANSGWGLTFAHPWLLLLLLLVPLIAWLRGQRGASAALVFSSTATLQALGKRSASRAGRFMRGLLYLALTIFILALARPQLGKSLTEVEASGIDIMVVLDVSNSMLAKDFTIGGEEATRLDAVRETTRKFIEARPNDRIGMIAFGSNPYIVSPLTLDHDWLIENLDRVRIGLVEGATAIGSAMGSAGSRLNDKASKSRAIILLTDGDNNAGRLSPTTAAEAIKALGLKFYAVGIGTNGIAPFPAMDSRGRVLTDTAGNVVYQTTRVSFNEKGLKEIAQIAGGKFYRATDTDSLENIYREIEKLEKSTVSVKKFQQYRDLFPACLMAGVGVLLAELLLSQTIWKKLP